MDTLLQDLRFSLRLLRRQPGFTALVVLRFTIVGVVRGVRVWALDTEPAPQLYVLTPALGGIGLGLGVAWAGSRLLESLIYGVSATDPLSFLMVPVILAGVALLAAWLPARRATQVDPTEALRQE